MSKLKRADPKAKLYELIKLPENMVCADCGSKQPRWASASIGVFVCIRCSGLHRNLGTHLSFVRSVNLDEWKPEQVQRMVNWGNGRAKEYFEHDVPPGYPVPTEHSSVQHVTKWIRDKYEYCKFVPRNMPECDPRRGGLPPRSYGGDADPRAAAVEEPPAPVQQQHPRAAQPSAHNPPPPTRAATVKPALKMQPKPRQQPQPPPPPPAPVVPDLLDFSAAEEVAPPPPAAPAFDPALAFGTVTSPQAQQQPHAQQQQQQFPGSAVPPQPSQQPPQQQQRMNSDAIMSMFGQQNPHMGFGVPQPQPMPGGFPQHQQQPRHFFPQQQQQQQQQQMAHLGQQPRPQQFPGGFAAAAAAPPMHNMMMYNQQHHHQQQMGVGAMGMQMHPQQQQQQPMGMQQQFGGFPGGFPQQQQQQPMMPPRGSQMPMQSQPRPW